jgi:hypothetical protein
VTVTSVPLVTSARPGHSAQVRRRRRAYLAVQGVRISMFVVAIVAPLPLLVRGALVVAACLMSMFSVTAANAPYPRSADRHVEGPGRRELGQ